MNNSPQDFDIPHDEFRPGQLRGLNFFLDAEEHQVSLASAPTGSGKSSWPTGVSSRRKVVAISHTKSLQRQYQDIYEFDMVTGRSNHPCISDSRLLNSSTAEDCLFGSSMHKCPDASSCPYIMQKEAAKASHRAALNYAFWLIVNKKWVESAEPDDVFLDEGHTLPEITLSFVGVKITDRQVSNYRLPPLPHITYTLPKIIQRNLALPWLEKSIVAVKSNIKTLKSMTRSNPAKWMPITRRAERFLGKLSGTLGALRAEDEDWYVNCRDGELTIKPLTARHHFPFYFTGDYRTHIQSATIGNPEVLADELGIEEYKYLDVPNQFTPDQRPVYVLDCPRMGATSVRNNPSHLEHQADQIADLVKKYDPSWHWLMHAQSKKKIKELLERLARRGLQDRVWQVPETGTDQQVAAWELRRRTPGTVIGSWSWSEGVDLGEVNGTVSCDIPFGYLGDPYIKARMMAFPLMYKQMAAWLIEQRCGRIRRGVPEHYNINGVERKVVAIADANISMIDKFLSDEFKKSLVRL